MLGSSSRLGLIQRGWEGCSLVRSAVPGVTFSPIAAQHFHPHAAASGFVSVPLSNNLFFGQHTCVYSRARLAWLGQQNFSGCTVFQTVTNLSSEEISEPGGVCQQNGWMLWELWEQPRISSVDTSDARCHFTGAKCLNPTANLH